MEALLTWGEVHIIATLSRDASMRQFCPVAHTLPPGSLQ